MKRGYFFLTVLILIASTFPCKSREILNSLVLGDSTLPFVRNAGELSADFILRMAPAGASQVSLLAEDPFNSKTIKLVYAYVKFEGGNLVEAKDSSLSYFLDILTPSVDNEQTYSRQTLKMITSYKKSTRIEKADVVYFHNERALMVYVSELVRGPGGVPRDVKRTLVYSQEKMGDKYTDTFFELKQK